MEKDFTMFLRDQFQELLANRAAIRELQEKIYNTEDLVKRELIKERHSDLLSINWSRVNRMVNNR
jgi:hypothetical protein